jgi:hypothetical protein
MKIITFTAVVAALTLTGCATNRLYTWGNYDDMLYRQYKDPAQALDMRTKLEAHVAQLEQNRQKVPPGIYAEIGTLYLQSNDKVKAVSYYRKEHDLWPESRGLMTAMISTISRQTSPATSPAQ